MTEQTFRTSAEAAAAWWAKQLGAPVYRMVGDDADREDRFRADFASMVMLGEVARHPMSSDQGDAFVAALAPKIEEMLGRVDWVSLGVDYGPDLELAEAAKAAGISTDRFPWKTHMSITKDYVTASLGYRSPTKLIWTAPDWVRPACGMQRYEEIGDDWECRDEVCSLLKFHDGDHGTWVPDSKRCADCGGTYTGHFGSKADRPWTHSWNPKAGE